MNTINLIPKSDVTRMIWALKVHSKIHQNWFNDRFAGAKQYHMCCCEPFLFTTWSSIFFFFLVFFFFNFYFLTLQYCIGFAIHQHESATGIHVFPIPNTPPTSLPLPSLWPIPVHQPQATSIMHQTWAGVSFHIWYYTCFSAILPNHPTLSLSHRVQKTVLYICVSFAVSHRGLSLPSF